MGYIIEWEVAVSRIILTFSFNFKGECWLMIVGMTKQTVNISASLTIVFWILIWKYYA